MDFTTLSLNFFISDILSSCSQFHVTFHMQREACFPFQTSLHMARIFCEIFCSGIVWKKDARYDLKVNCQSLSRIETKLTYVTKKLN